MALKELIKGMGRKVLRKSSPEGAIIAELQDVVENHPHIVAVRVSWETDEQGFFPVHFLHAAKIEAVVVVLTKDLEPSNGASVAVLDPSGSTMGNGGGNFLAGQQKGDFIAIYPTSKNITQAGEGIFIDTSKATPGGKGIAFIHYKRVF